MTITFQDYDPAAEILGLAKALLENSLSSTPAGCPQRLFIGHGPVTFDCEQAWVRAIAVYPSRAGTGQDDEGKANTRRPPLQQSIDVEIGVIRCVHTVQEAAGKIVIPSADDTTFDAVQHLADRRAIAAVPIYLWPKRGEPGALVGADRTQLRTGAWAPIGNEGGLAGGVITFSATLVDCPPTVTP